MSTVIYRHFPVTNEACCARTQFGFVTCDQRDRLEVTNCPMVAVIGRKEVEKMAERCYCTTQPGLFWAIFRQPVALRVANLDSGLLMVLRRVRW